MQADVIAFDAELEGLIVDRQRLLKDIAPILRRVGPNHPDRKKLNKVRAAKRKNLRRALARNADAICARIMVLHDQPEYAQTSLNLED